VEDEEAAEVLKAKYAGVKEVENVLSFIGGTKRGISAGR